MNAQEAQQLTQQARSKEILKTLDRVRAQAGLGYDYAQVGQLWPQTVAELKRLGYQLKVDGSHTEVRW